MALVVYDRVQETTATTGTGSITLGGAVDGFQSFAIVGNGNTTYYCIVNGLQWEVGLGTYSTSGPTLARTTVYSNSSGTLSPITLVGASNVFLTYPSERSVNLNASGNVTALGTVTSGAWNGSTIPVAYGGTGVTASSGANSVMLRDANQNVAINRLNQANTNTAAAGGITALTAGSSYSQTLTGTGNQTYTMPDATTLATGVAFVFNNNATGTLTLQDYASGSIGIVTSGGAVELICVSAATTGGTWDYHGFLPENVTWGTNALALGGTVITGGTWNGGTIQSGYGGTGLTTFTAANNALYSTSSSTLAAGTLPIAAGGTAKTSFTANQVLYGSLSQSGNLLFDGASLTVGGATITGSGSQIAGGAWGVLPYAFNSLTIDNSGGAARFFATGANSSTYGSYIWYGGLTTGATNQYMTLDTSGNLLLNTSTTGGKITSVASSGQLVAGNFSGASGQFTLALSIAGGNNMYLATVSNADESLRFINSGGGELVRITSAGSVGIGTASPGYTLTVNGGITAINNQQIGINGTGVSAGAFVFRNSSGVMKSGIGSYYNVGNEGNIEFINGSTTNMILSSTGNFALGTTTTTSAKAYFALGSLGTLGSVVNVASFGTNGVFSLGGAGGNSDGLYFGTGDTAGGSVASGFGFLREASGWDSAIAFYTNNVTSGPNGVSAITERMRLTSTGALSFGAGGTNYGSSGQLLQSNGNASPSWINQSSITAGSASNVAGLVANTYTTYGNLANTTAKSGYYGMLLGTTTSHLTLMADGSGNGGFYKENTGAWPFYYLAAHGGVGIMSSTTESGIAMLVNGIGKATSDFRAPIFYDSADTTYYWNLNGGSNLSTQITGYAQFQSNYNTASGSSPPLQAYSTGGAGAVMAFHRAGAYGLNFGLDSDNVLRIGGWSAPSNRWQLDMSGNNTIAGYMSATIYYDNPNSSYYVDPDSTSVLYNLTINGTGSKYLRIISTNAQEAMVYYEGSTGTQWYVGKRITAQLVGTADFHWYNVANNNTMMGLTVAGELLTRGGMYAPAFYDIDNPAYYLNPANRSYLYTFTMGDSNEINQLCTNVTTSSIIGLGFNGSDSSYAIFKSAGAWVQPLNIKFYTGVRLYAAYNYDYGISFWDQVGGGLLMSVGQGDYNVRVSNTIYSAISSSSSAMVSPIYYATNTAYYVQPAADSNIGTITSNNHYIRAGQMLYSDHGGWTGEYNKIQWHGGNMYFQNTSTGLFQFRNSAGTDVISFTTAGAGTFQGTVTAPSGGFNTSASYVSNGQLGLYNASYGGYFYQIAGQQWVMSFNGNTDGCLALRQSYNGTVKVQLYYDGSGSGMLTNTGNWGVRMNYDGGAAPGGTMYGAWTTTGDISTGTVFRGQVFYDSNDPAYYVDPTGTSVIQRTVLRRYGNIGANDTQLEISNANTGSACVIAFHREGAYGANFSLATDNVFTTAGWSSTFTGLDTGVLRVLKNDGTNSVVFLTSRPGVADSFYLYASDAWAPNGDPATMKIGSMSWTGRSINATGSVNQYGGDYAEYMTKNGDFTIAKGDVCGIDVDGKLTNVFAEAISFVVKSTEPGLVGGDTWGNSEALGMEMPMEPIRMAEETDESLNARKAQYEINKPIFQKLLDAARVKVDRIAFCGQVPVNVTGAVSGQYIVAVNDNGAIKGIAVNEDDLTMSQYIKAVGKVIKVVDGRPTIIVKVS